MGRTGRRFRLAMFVVAAGLLVGTATVRVALATSSVVVLSDRVNIDAPVARAYPITIPVGKTSATRTLFLHTGNGSRPSSPAVLFADPHDTGDVSVALAGGDGGGGPSLNVDLAAGKALVRLTVTATRGGKADLGVRVGRAATILTTLVVQPAPVVTIAGASDAGLTVGSHTTPFSLQVLLHAGEAKARNVSAQVNPFIDEKGQPVGVDCAQIAAKAPKDNTCNKSPVTMPPRGSAWLVIRASLPLSGSWRSAFTLRHDGAVQSPVPLTVNRSLAATSLEIDAVALARVDTWWRREATVSRTISVRETTGRTVTVSRPALLPVSRTDGKAVVGEDAKLVSVTDITDSASPKPIGETFKVANGETRQLRVVVQLPHRAAEYALRLRFAEPGAAPTTVALTATVRRTPWSPFWWILLGLLVSLLARYLWKVRRARLTAEVPIARLAGRLGRVRARNAPLDPQETRLLDGVAAALSAVDAEARSGDANVAAGQLEVMVVRVAAADAWVALRRRVLAGPEQLRPDYLGRLERLASRITADADEDKAAADQLTADLKQINSDYDTAASGAIKQAIADFRAVLGRFGLADADTNRTLTAADAAVDTSPEVAADQLAQAQAAAVGKLTGRLQAELAAGPDPSLDLTADEWDTAVAPVREALAKVATAPDAASKLASYQEADAALLHVVATALMRRLRRRIATLEEIQQPAASVRQELERHQQTLADVVRADRQVATDPAAARQAIEDAVTRFNEALPTDDVLDATGREEGMAEPMGASVQPVGFIPAAPGAAPEAEKIPTVADLRRQLGYIEVLATIVAFALAVPIGISFLYASNHTWGSAADALAAFAWGLGAQQVSGQSFTGVFALRDQVFGAS